MLNAVQSEMGRYQRIITYWPCCEWGGVQGRGGSCHRSAGCTGEHGLGRHITTPAELALHNCRTWLLTNCTCPVTLLPADGPDLERAVTGALREATLGVSRQCGLVQIKVGMGWWSWAMLIQAAH